MTRDEVQEWLDRYVQAWLTYDRAEIATLFSEDAEYRYRPWDEPVRGVDAIVASWVEPDGTSSGRDEAGTYDGHYMPYVVEGDRAVAVGWSSYWTDAERSTVRDVYDNAWLLEFDANGRCHRFTEFFMKRPAATGQ
jgi:hypothetical protein